MDDKKNYYHNCHDGYHNPHCWCNDNYSGGCGNMGCFGVVTGTILLLIATVVVLTLIITAFGADADDIPSGLLMFLFIIVMSIIGGVASVFKK